MTMEEQTWYEGLRARGRDWVLDELNRRPGMPQDPLHDVVYSEPYPTREFCQRWCVEVDNQYLRLSGFTKGLLCGLAILTIFIAMAIHSLNSTGPAGPRTAPSHSAQG
jgi:hypothetical protein